mgnify:CR=1 FL=1
MHQISKTIKKLNIMKDNMEELKRLFNDLTIDEKIDFMTEAYYGFYDADKDKFLREIECN